MPFHAVKTDCARYDCGDKVGFLHANIAVGLSRPDIAPRSKSCSRHESVKFGFRPTGWVGLLAGCLALAGCSTQNNDYGQYYQLMRQSIAATFSNGAVTRQDAAKIPYATIGYRVNGGRENMLILATDTNGDRLWTAPSHLVLVTRDGRLIRTVGLADNLASVTPSLSTATSPPGQVLKNAFTSIRSADFPDEGRYSVSITCKTVSMGRVAIIILGKAWIRSEPTRYARAAAWAGLSATAIGWMHRTDLSGALSSI